MSELECPHMTDAAPLVLGALDDAEAEAYRAHLADCAACRAEVAQLRAVVHRLPEGAPAVRAPVELGERLMAVVRSEASLLAAAGSAADRVERPARRRWMLPGAALVAAAAAAAAIVVAVGGGGGGVTHTTSPGGLVASLRASGGHGVLDVRHMAPAPPGRVYEVWKQDAAGTAQPTDALFEVDRNGDATVAVPGDLHGVRRVMVTPEPLGGSRAPTSAPVVNLPVPA